jgi:putative FmdB family regulatory protein
MPIYEFRCAKCGHIQEFIVTGSSEEIDMKCDECQGDELERVMSSVNYAMGSSGSSSGQSSSPSSTTRTCAPGKSCTTLNLPGHTK